MAIDILGQKAIFSPYKLIQKNICEEFYYQGNLHCSVNPYLLKLSKTQCQLVL